MSAHFSTDPAPAFRWLSKIARRDMTVYIISDMEFREVVTRGRLSGLSHLKNLARFSPRVALFLISGSRRALELFVKQVKTAGINDVKGYWVNPVEAHRLTEYVIQEINL